MLSLAGALWAGVVATYRVLSMDQINLNCIIMLNWVAWNWTVLIFKLRTYAQLNYLQWNCFCILNWIVWNRTVFDIETLLTLNWIVWNRTVYMFKDRCGINKLQWLMCHKSKQNQTKQSKLTNQLCIIDIRFNIIGFYIRILRCC